MPVFSVGNRLSVPRAGAGHWVPGFPSLFVFLSAPPVLAFSCSTSSCPPSAFIRLLFLSPSVVLPPSLSLPPLCVPLSLRLTHSRSRSSLTVPWRLLLPCPSLPLSLTHTHILFHDVSHTVRFSLSRSFSPSLSPPFSSSPLFSPFRLPHSLFILVPPPPSFLPPLTLSSDVSPLFLWPCPSASFSHNLTHSLSLGASFFLLLAVFLPCPIHAALCRPPFCLTSLCQLLPSAPKAQGGEGGTELFRQFLSPRAGDSRPPIVGLCSLAPGAWPPCPIHVPGLQSRFSPRTPRLLFPGARFWISIVRGRTRFADLARKRAMPSPPCPGTPCFRAALGCLHPSGRAPRLPPTGRPALVCPTTSLRPPFRGRPSSRPATSPGSPPPASAGCP